MAYYQFKGEDGTGYGSCEVFHATANQAIAWDWVEPDGDGRWTRNDGYGKEYCDPSELAGWYFQACFPGCLPDGEAIGPFETESEAIEAADLVTD
jgi:hypothetical protein